MKCEYCGSKMQPGSHICPFCGLAANHIDPTQSTFQKEPGIHQVTDTKTASGTGSRLKTPFIAFFILLILNICAGTLVIKSWDIADEITVWQVEKNAESHQQEIERRLESQDYIGYYLYYYDNNLYACSDFDCYHAVTLASSNLYYLYEIAVDFSDDRQFSFSEETLSDTAEKFTDYVNFLFSIERRCNYEPDYVTDDKLAIIADIQNQAKGILVAYCGLTIEEANEIPDLSYEKQYEILERGLSRL